MSDTPAPTPVFLVDGSSFMFRAYHQSINQDPRYNVRPSDGQPTGAVRLFVTKILQFVQDGAAGVHPSHLIIAFDKATAESPRKKLYPEYKANRTAPPDDMRAQIPLIRQAVRAFGLTPIEAAGIEADDLIAAYAKDAVAKGHEVLIVTSDKDLMQLVGPKVRLYDFESGIPGKPGYRPERNMDEAAVMEKWEGLAPSQIGDALALMGDTSDNVPGIPGIGLKTAAQLIREYGDLETLLQKADQIKQPKRRELLQTHAETARLSRQLVALDDQCGLPVPLEEMAFAQPDPRRLVSFLKALELNTIMRRVAKIYGVDVEAVEADPELAAKAPEPSASAEGEDTDTPQGLAVARSQEVRKPFSADKYQVVETVEQLRLWLGAAREKGHVAISVETSDAHDLVGLAFAVEPGLAAYVPLGHRQEQTLFGGGDAAVGQLPVDDVLDEIQELLEDASVLKIGHDVKQVLRALQRVGIHQVTSIDDVTLMAYVLDAGRSKMDYEGLSDRHLGHQPPSLAEVLGMTRGKPDIVAADPMKVAAYAARKPDVAIRLWMALKPRLVAERRATVYETLERPLVPVLARMEYAGIGVDRGMLSRLSGDFSQTLARLEDEIYGLAGERFVLGSPKQIGDILFDKLGLPGAKKTATGQWATPASLLEELAEAGHALPEKILEWRQLSKLKSTYTDALQSALDPETMRVHTTFALAATTTGRLSSSDPNLQNIPIRTEIGRKIRAAFVAADGYKILSADYSQIELRLLAHIADIPQLRQAFADGIDIHSATASAMFNVPLSEMTSELRRRAKTINFGIIYGISAFGLAARLGIPQHEAGAFIKQYFERFPGIRDYMEETKRVCREQGYVTTLFGRVCHFPGIRLPNANERQAVERAAINAPIQGTAADIVRRAMVRMEDALAEAGLSAGMLLQVHDELVFEVPEDEVEATIPVVRRVMENAADPVVKISVPLLVEAKAAANWDEAH